MAEWFKALVSKTSIPSRESQVQILSLPPEHNWVSERSGDPAEWLGKSSRPRQFSELKVSERSGAPAVWRGESCPSRQLENEVIGSPAPTSLKLRRASTRARQPFFGKISNRFEFSKAKSGLFLKEINNFAIIVL